MVAAGSMLRLEPVELPGSRRIRADRLYPGNRYTESARTLQVPLPGTGTANSRSPLAGVGVARSADDGDIVAWTGSVLRALLDLDQGA